MWWEKVIETLPCVVAFERIYFDRWIRETEIALVALSVEGKFNFQISLFYLHSLYIRVTYEFSGQKFGDSIYYSSSFLDFALSEADIIRKYFRNQRSTVQSLLNDATINEPHCMDVCVCTILPTRNPKNP